MIGLSLLVNIECCIPLSCMTQNVSQFAYMKFCIWTLLELMKSVRNESIMGGTLIKSGLNHLVIKLCLRGGWHFLLSKFTQSHEIPIMDRMNSSKHMVQSFHNE
jgi:hypothetical protein